MMSQHVCWDGYAETAVLCLLVLPSALVLTYSCSSVPPVHCSHHTTGIMRLQDNLLDCLYSASAYDI